MYHVDMLYKLKLSQRTVRQDRFQRTY